MEGHSMSQDSSRPEREERTYTSPKEVSSPDNRGRAEDHNEPDNRVSAGESLPRGLFELSQGQCNFS